MKKIRKCINIVVLFAILSSLLFLTGCHSRKGLAEFELPKEFDTSRNYEITFWAKNDTNKTQTNIYKKAIADFESIYPNIKVNIKLYTDYGRIYNDIITNIPTNTVPNVCITYPDHIATYLTGRNIVVPLDELFDNEKYGLGASEVRFDSPKSDEIIPQFLNECKFDGHYYALPYMRSTEACYINKTYVEKLGFTVPDVLTWDFIWKVSDAATAKDSEGNYIVNGQKVLIPFIYKSSDNMMIQMLKQQDAGYSNNDADVLIFNDTTENMLYEIAKHVENGVFSTFKISGYPANYLNAGQCIFAIDSTAGATWMGSEAPLLDISEENIVNFETVVRTVPQFNEEDPKMISQGPSVCIFNKEDPQEVVASWLFMQYLLTNNVQVAYSKTEGYVPVTSKAKSSAEYMDYLSREGETDENGNVIDEYYDIKIKASKLIWDNVDNMFVTSVFNGSASLRDAAGQLIENTVKSVKRNEVIDDEYMDNLEAKVSSLYRLDQIKAQRKSELGEMPSMSKWLLGSLAVVWFVIVLYIVVNAVKRRKS